MDSSPSEATAWKRSTREVIIRVCKSNTTRHKVKLCWCSAVVVRGHRVNKNGELKNSNHLENKGDATGGLEYAPGIQRDATEGLVYASGIQGDATGEVVYASVALKSANHLGIKCDATGRFVDASGGAQKSANHWRSKGDADGRVVYASKSANHGEIKNDATVRFVYASGVFKVEVIRKDSSGSDVLKRADHREIKGDATERVVFASGAL